jgi:hypothetical protein
MYMFVKASAGHKELALKLVKEGAEKMKQEKYQKK